MNLPDLTIITTYYNEPDLLSKFIEQYTRFKKTYNNLKLIVVDDGSLEHPALDSYDWTLVKDVMLYRVDEDLGFNSHGARNLAMTETTTEWNMLVDVDNVININTFDVLSKQEFDLYDVYELTINGFVISKTNFLSFKGYDEEFVNMHYGDRFVISYLKETSNYVKLAQIQTKTSRKARKVIHIEIPKTIYEKDRMYHPLKAARLLGGYKQIVRERYNKRNFSKKKILNFTWQRLI